MSGAFWAKIRHYTLLCPVSRAFNCPFIRIIPLQTNLSFLQPQLPKLIHLSVFRPEKGVNACSKEKYSPRFGVCDCYTRVTTETCHRGAPHPAELHADRPLRTPCPSHCHVCVNRLQSFQHKAREAVLETSREKSEFAHVCQNQQGHVNFTPGQKLGSIAKCFSL